MRIDAHIHLSGDDAQAVALLRELDVKVININVAHLAKGQWREQYGLLYRELSTKYPQQYADVTSFDLPDADDFAHPDRYAQAVIAKLEEDFAAGVVGCKVWKNVGMELLNPAGELVLVDDMIFEPIFRYLEDHGRTLLMHIGEPLACWQPLDLLSPHQAYYTALPEWHMFGRKEMHSHQALVDSQSRLMARHTKLRCVGAHMGSEEYDVDAVAARMDRFPNFAVDTSARMEDLALQDPAKVRAFLIKYADRVLFGTDVVIRTQTSHMSPQEHAATIQRLRDRYAREFGYFDTDGTLDVVGQTRRGVNLPASVQTKIYTDNAVRWYGL